MLPNLYSWLETLPTTILQVLGRIGKLAQFTFQRFQVWVIWYYVYSIRKQGDPNGKLSVPKRRYTHNFTEVPTFRITHGCIVEIKAQSGHLKLIFGHLYGICMNLFTFVNLILAFSTSIWLKQSIDGKLVMKSFKWYQLYNIWF